MTFPQFNICEVICVRPPGENGHQWLFSHVCKISQLDSFQSGYLCEFHCPAGDSVITAKFTATPPLPALLQCHKYPSTWTSTEISDKERTRSIQECSHSGNLMKRRYFRLKQPNLLKDDHALSNNSQLYLLWTEIISDAHCLQTCVLSSWKSMSSLHRINIWVFG